MTSELTSLGHLQTLNTLKRYTDEYLQSLSALASLHTAEQAADANQKNLLTKDRLAAFNKANDQMTVISDLVDVNTASTKTNPIAFCEESTKELSNHLQDAICRTESGSDVNWAEVRRWHAPAKLDHDLLKADEVPKASGSRRERRRGRSRQRADSDDGMSSADEENYDTSSGSNSSHSGSESGGEYSPVGAASSSGNSIANSDSDSA